MKKLNLYGSRDVRSSVSPQSKDIKLEARIAKMEECKEEITTVRLIWKDLGVAPEYKKAFELNLTELNESLRKGYLATEIDSLRAFAEKLDVDA